MTYPMRIRIYVEGLEHSYTNDPNDSCPKGFPKDAACSFIKRIANELLSPNRINTHECNFNCKRVIGIMIGRTDDDQNSGWFKNAIPR